MSNKRGKRTRRTSTNGDRSGSVDIVTQLECAVRHPQATAIGAIVGGLVPWFARTLAHEEVPTAWSDGSHGLALVMIAVVLGCACFSALTVYKFGRAAFGDSRKAFGFVLALEGVMLISHGGTSLAALAILIAINAVGNGSVIALARDATKRRREADQRRATTRSQNRAGGRSEQPSMPYVSPAPASSSQPISTTCSDTTSLPSMGQALTAPIRWNRATIDDVIDVEIVSEERLLS
jgi:hypothetical protein